MERRPPVLRDQVLECAIAGKSVKVKARSGIGLLEPGRPYIRCSERDCQYVDRNEAPCPLRPEMSDDGTARQILDHLARAPQRSVCYSCLAEIATVTHDQVRRAMWLLNDHARVAIGPARCAKCERRRLSVRSIGDHRGTTTAMRPEEDDAEMRVMAALRDAGTELTCAACVAFLTKMPLAEVRRSMELLSGREQCQRRQGLCHVCHRWQPIFSA